MLPVFAGDRHRRHSRSGRACATQARSRGRRSTRRHQGTGSTVRFLRHFAAWRRRPTGREKASEGVRPRAKAFGARREAGSSPSRVRAPRSGATNAAAAARRGRRRASQNL